MEVFEGSEAPGWGLGWDSPASLASGKPRASARGAGSGRSAQLPRAPGAGAACPGPVGLELRAAGRGEENNRRGGREREGRRERGTRGPPHAWTGSARWGPKPGALRVPKVGESPSPLTWQVISSTTHRPLAFRASRGARKGSSNPWRSAGGLYPRARRTSRHQALVGGPAKHPLPAPINPFGTASVLGPALSPQPPGVSSVPGMLGGKEKVSGLGSFPRSPPILQAPAPPRSSPQTTHQIEAALH